MAKQFFLPDGGYVSVPDTMSFEEADAKARQKFPEAYGIKQQHGFIPALKTGMREGVGAGIKGIGALAGFQGMESYGAQMMAPDLTPGAYHPYTDEEIARRDKEGLFSGLGARIAKYGTEPVGEMVGRYAIPTAVGAGAALLAPEAAGAAALARGAGFIAADFPSEVGENIQRQEQVAPDAAIDKTNAVAAGLAQAALLPVLGHLGNRATQYFKLMGPDLAATARAVTSGQMTQEAAIASLNSTAKNLLVKTGEAAAVGAPMMVGTEALRTAQAGEDVMGAPAMGRYGEALGAAAAFAPLGGLMGGLGRRGQVRAVEQAGEGYRTRMAEQEAAAQREADMQQALQGNVDVTGDLGLTEPRQPKGKDVYRGAEAPQAEDVLNRGFFNALGLPNKGVGAELRQYEGTALQDPKIQDVRDTLARLVDPESAPKWMTDTKAAKIQAVLDSPVLKRHIREAAPEQADMFTPENLAAIDAQRKWQAKQDAINAAAAREQSTGVGGTQDMFSGVRANRVQPEKVRRPVQTLEEYKDRGSELYDQFLAAHDEFQRTGDSTRLDSVLAQAKAELGPLDATLNRASTQKMFTKRGEPMPEATRYAEKPTQPVEPIARGAGDAAPVQLQPERGVGEPGIVPERMGSRAPADERAVMGEKPEPAPLKKKERPAREEAPEVTEPQAAEAWEDARGGDPNYPAFENLHPDAQASLRAKMELRAGELSGKDFKAVARTHNDALRSERIAREVKAELDPDAAMRHGEEAPLEVQNKAGAEAMVKNITAKWTNAPKVDVKNTHELEPEWRAWAEKNNPKGFIKKDGSITILADRNTGLPDVKATLFHEALGHYGLRAKFRSELNTVLGDIYKTNEAVRKLADAERADNKKLSVEQAVEEVLAEKQITGGPVQNAFNRVIAKVREYLRKVGLVDQYTDNDIVHILRQSRDIITKGERTAAPQLEEVMARKKEKPFSSNVPAGMKITLEREGPKGEIIEETVKARATLREAERRVAMLDALKECLGA